MTLPPQITEAIDALEATLAPPVGSFGTVSADYPAARTRLTDAIAAHIGGVGVKDLVWTSDLVGRWIGEPVPSIGGLAFWIFQDGDGRFRRASNSGWKFYATLAEAQAAAQADYTARILSALTPAPLPDAVARLVEAGNLYLDLDGVMADFDAHFPAEFGLDHKSMADDDMWARINAHPSYFEDMPMCHGADAFFAEIRHLNPIILTACPRTNYAHVAGQKRRWVQKHLGAGITVLPIMGGHNKHLFMNAPGDVLIDDYEKNCAPWRKSGGVAILHTTFDETRAALAAIQHPHPMTATRAMKPDEKDERK